jgi:hypothetical protein
MSAKVKVGDVIEIVDLGEYIQSKDQGLFVGNTGIVAKIYGDSGGVYALDIRTNNAEQPTDEEGVGWFFESDCVRVIDNQPDEPGEG